MRAFYEFLDFLRETWALFVLVGVLLLCLGWALESQANLPTGLDACPAFDTATLPNGALVVYRDCGDHVVTEYPWREE